MKLPPLKIFIFLLSFVVIFSCKSDDDEDNIDDPKAENLKALGTSAEDILSDDLYTSLTVELIYSDGFRPLQETINSFRSFLDERVNKPDGIQIVETIIDAPQNAPFTTEEIRNIESNNRTQYTEGDNIAVSIFFSNGISDNDSETRVTLGKAYRNTSVVVYEKTIMDVSVLPNGPDLYKLEATTLQHEFSHLFGLVNILGDDIHTNHEDPNNSKHCIVEDCLMYFESTNANKVALRNMQLPNIPQLDPLCIADLRAKGGK